MSRVDFSSDVRYSRPTAADSPLQKPKADETMPEPEWVAGFNRAMTQSLINADYTMKFYGDYESTDGPVLSHMRECEIASVARVDQEVESVSTFDSFDPDRSYPAGFVEVTFTCACGHFRDKVLRKEGTVTDFIYGITHAID